MLVLDDRRLEHAPGSALDGLAVRLGRVGYAQRDVLHPVAVHQGELADLGVAAEGAREDEADLSLLEHVARPIADSGFRAGIGDTVEAERVLVVVRSLLRVADPQLDVVPAVQRHEVLAHRAECTPTN